MVTWRYTYEERKLAFMAVWKETPVMCPEQRAAREGVMAQEMSLLKILIRFHVGAKLENVQIWSLLCAALFHRTRSYCVERVRRRDIACLCCSGIRRAGYGPGCCCCVL